MSDARSLCKERPPLFVPLLLGLFIVLIAPLMLEGAAAGSDEFFVTQGFVRVCNAEINDQGLPELPDGKQTCSELDAVDSSALTGSMMVDRMGSVWEVSSLDVDFTDDLDAYLVSDITLSFPITNESGWPAKLIATLENHVLRFDGDCDDDVCLGPTPFIVQLDYTLLLQPGYLVLASDVELDHSDDGETATLSGTAELGAVVPLPGPVDPLAVWMSAQITFVPEPSLPLAQAASLASLLALARSRRRARSSPQLR